MFAKFTFLFFFVAGLAVAAWMSIAATLLSGGHTVHCLFMMHQPINELLKLTIFERSNTPSSKKQAWSLYTLCGPSMCYPCRELTGLRFHSENESSWWAMTSDRVCQSCHDLSE